MSFESFRADGPVWYGPPLADPCALRRAGSADLPFWGIVGVTDAVALGGFAIAADVSLRYWTTDVDLDEGDLVIVGCALDPTDERVIVLDDDGKVQGGTLYRVRSEPRHVNNGDESGTLLSTIGENDGA